MPFINNEINGIVRRALKRHGINARVINLRPQTVGQLCQKQRPAAKCKVRKCPIPHLNSTATFVVYQVKCNLCGNTYIGSTSKQLHYRTKEHIATAEHHSADSAMGEHYGMSHVQSKPNLSFSILCGTSHGDLRLRITEAYEIETRNQNSTESARAWALDS